MKWIYSSQILNHLVAFPSHLVRNDFLRIIESIGEKNLPNKILAMRTKCWLLEESRNEAMIFHIEDIFLFEGTFTISLTVVDLILLLISHIIFVTHFDFEFWLFFVLNFLSLSLFGLQLDL